MTGRPTRAASAPANPADPARSKWRLPVQAGELALFPEDVPIPEQALCELWGLDEFVVKEKVLRLLDDLSMDPRERTVAALQANQASSGCNV
jgi:hypothetical protein